MMKLTKRKGFNFFRSYYDVYNELSDKEKVMFIDALLDRQFLGVKPKNLTGMAKFAYISQVNSIDSQVKGFEDKTGIILTPTEPPTDGGKLTPRQQVEGKGKVEEKGKEQYVAVAPDWFDEKLLIAWNDWLKHRKELKKKMTESTAKKQIEFLRARGPDAVAIINQAIEKGWTGLYELQNKQNNGFTRGSNKGGTTEIKSFGDIDYTK